MLSRWFIAAIEALILAACALLMPEETKVVARLTVGWMRFQTVRLWHWSSRWEWYAALFVGAATAIGFGEYLAGLLLLGLSALALFSKLIHWSPVEQSPRWVIVGKAVGGLGIAGGTTLLVLIMLDIKGTNPWSHLPAIEDKYVDTYSPIAAFDITRNQQLLLPPQNWGHTTPVWVMEALHREIKKIRVSGPSGTIPRKADVILRVVDAKQFSIVIETTSEVLAHDPKLSILLWDLDLAGRDEPLPIPPTTQDNGAWIRKEEMWGPFKVEGLPAVAALIKPGHRIFGFATVTCSDCISEKAYWISVIHGTGGWYSLIPGNKFPNVKKLAEALPEIRQNTEHFLSGVPEAARFPVGDAQQ